MSDYKIEVTGTDFLNAMKELRGGNAAIYSAYEKLFSENPEVAEAINLIASQSQDPHSAILAGTLVYKMMQNAAKTTADLEALIPSAN